MRRNPFPTRSHRLSACCSGNTCRGRFLEVGQPSSERILHFKIENYNAEEGLTVFTLIFEATGRFANLLLVDGEGRILDAIKRLPERDGESRPVLPGALYTPPPTPAGRRLETLAVQDLQVLIDRSPAERPLRQILVEEILGVSPFLAAEVLSRAGLAPETTAGAISPEETPARAEKIHSTLDELYRQVKTGEIHPYCYEKNRQAEDFFPYRPLSLPEATLVPAVSINQAVASTLDQRESQEELAARRRDLLKIITRARKKSERKAEKQQEELARAEDADLWRIYGELLTAYRHQVPRGASQVELVNYYDPEGKTVTIPLDPALPVNQDAQNYFKNITRLRKGLTRIAAELEKTREELLISNPWRVPWRMIWTMKNWRPWRKRWRRPGSPKAAGPRAVPGRPRRAPGGLPFQCGWRLWWERTTGRMTS